MRKILLGGLGSAAGVLCVFFAYYTIRLIYINLFRAGVSEHRQAGMALGAIAFPIAALGFGWLSLRCFRFITKKS